MDFAVPSFRPSKADYVYDELRKELVTGAYAFGEVFSTYDLAERFGVSRRPVMDAVMRLESAGFITIIRQVGCQVVIPDPRTVQEHFAVAAILEGAGARLAAQNADETTLDEIERVHERGAEPARTNDLQRFTETNRQFHAAILDASGNLRLADLAKHAWDLSDFYLRDRPTADLAKSQDEHADIIAALRRRDADTARASSIQVLDRGGHPAEQVFISTTTGLSGFVMIKLTRRMAGPAQCAIKFRSFPGCLDALGTV